MNKLSLLPPPILSSLLAVSALAWSTVPVQAEVIRLKSGQKVEGKILKVEKDRILVDAGIEMPVTYFKDEIKEVLPDPPTDAAALNDQMAQADRLEAKAVELIDENRMDQGLELIKQALTIYPTPHRHMNYGSILFGNGVELYKKERQDEGKAILKQSEEELKKAIQGFDPAKEGLFIAQAYFLLGEMYKNAFADSAQAKEFYQKSVSLADHDGAKSALSKLP